MKAGKVLSVAVLAGVISVGVAVFGQRWFSEGRTLDISLPLKWDRSGDMLDRLPQFKLPNLQGEKVSSSAWDGKVIILNFWATWCPPCLREMPLFIELQERHKQLQVVGIAIDTREEVAGFLEANPVNYPILLGETQAIEMSRRLGNRLQGLPFTVIFDNRGRRIHAQVGEMTRTALDKHLSALLPEPATAQTHAN